MIEVRCTIKRVVTIAICFLSSALYAWAQNPPPANQQNEDVISVYTELVQTDVMAFDKQGRFVNGLKREDFELRIDGKPQPIEFFERIAAGSTDEEAQLSAARRVPSANQRLASAPLDRSRTVFFYIDDLHLSASGVIFIRKALMHFIDVNLGQNDEVVITSASGQIGFLQQLTNNRTVLQAAIARIKAHPYVVRDSESPPMTEYQALLIDRSPASMGPSGRNYHDLTDYFVNKVLDETQDTSDKGREAAELRVRNRARTILQQAAAISQNTLERFNSLVRSSSQLSGRKLVFFISDGFFVDERNSDTASELRVITSAAALNGVVIYSLDARGLATDLPKAGDEVAADLFETESKGELLASREPMERLANDTGGRPIFDTNAMESGLANALNETSIYYLLAWRPNHEEQRSGKARRVEVILRGRPDITVRVRKNLLPQEVGEGPMLVAPKNQGRADTPPVTTLSQAIAAMYPARQLPVALDLQYLNASGKGIVLSITTEVKIDSRSFTNENGKEKAEVNLSGLVYNDEGKPGAGFQRKVTVTDVSDKDIGAEGKAFVYKHEILLNPGLYQIRVGARDEKTGRIGTVHEWIEIPDVSDHQLRLSSVMADEAPPLAANHSQSDQRTPPLLLRIDHRFQRASSLRFLFYIYNAARSQPNSQTDVALQVQIMRDRQPVMTAPLTKVPAVDVATQDPIPCGGNLPLQNLAPGRYLLLVTILDRVSKTSASQEMRFEVE